ncbi:hypothetical protein J1P26_18130 [Neobacillus sp. MM2021_6]|uniref:hypothetical protein n=1 Tax=Bacillaceae TaxID=186817 RepID=UPI00140A99BC|nr:MULTISPECIES: hypothetical protein [Bacillaceae]MBO0961627.1 hypothetical protein [Neobacillus sp. MM2021_6]NHC19458.1 hypothetical protein [Bacillus sp. MM2020_4]
MNWQDFIMGGISVIFTYALFSSGSCEEDTDIDPDEDLENNVVVNDFSSRHVILSCQTCRKQKRHKEIESNLYQCTKCKRHVDLRRVS